MKRVYAQLTYTYTQCDVSYMMLRLAPTIHCILTSLSVASYSQNQNHEVLINSLTMPYMAFCAYRINMKTDERSAYQSYGVNCTEVEVDVLTGEIEILRSDILFDCGQRYK